MTYEPAQVWLETNANGIRRVHLSAQCERLKPDSELSGPMLIGQAGSGGSSFCRCTKGTARAEAFVRRPPQEVSGGLPTLGRRR